jgi:hypothetical protein
MAKGRPGYVGGGKTSSSGRSRSNFSNASASRANTGSATVHPRSRVPAKSSYAGSGNKMGAMGITQKSQGHAALAAQTRKTAYRKARFRVTKKGNIPGPL